MTYNGITLMQGEDGVFREYNDEYDLVLHFESEKEQKDFIDRVNSSLKARPIGTWESDEAIKRVRGMDAYVCSHCESIWNSSKINNMHYCPACGADMRGEVIDT